MGGCGSKVELDLEAIDPKTATLKALRRKVKELNNPKSGTVDPIELERFTSLLAIKEELHAEPKAGKKEYLAPAETSLIDMQTETKRLQTLSDKAKEANVITEKEEEALQARRGLVEKVTRGKQAMHEAAIETYNSKMTVDSLRTRVRSLEATARDAISTINDAIGEKKKLSTYEERMRSGHEKSATSGTYAERTPEYAHLTRTTANVRAMADAKQSLISATAQGKQAGRNSQLQSAKSALASMKKACTQANAAQAHDAPEVAPCKEQIQRVTILVNAKQEVHDATTASVSGRMSVDHLRGPVTSRMLKARESSQTLDALSDAEARKVDTQLAKVEEMAQAKVACHDYMNEQKNKVGPMMTSEKLRAVANNEHKPLLERASRAGVADSPEYQRLKSEQDGALRMASSKDELVAARIAAVSVGAQTSLLQTRKVCERLAAAIKEAKACGTHVSNVFEPCVEKHDEVLPILQLKQMVFDAAQEGHPRMSVAQLQGEVTTNMEHAREAARDGNAYGGDVQQELEKRLRVIAEMANAKQKVASTMSVTVSEQVSVEALQNERKRMQELEREVAHLASGSPEVQALATFIDELEKAAEAKKHAQGALEKAQKLLETEPKQGCTVSFIGEEVEGCKRGNVKRLGFGSYDITPVSRRGNEKTEKVPCGTDEEGRPQYKTEPKLVQVRAEICVVAKPEDLKAQQQEVDRAIERLQKLQHLQELAKGCKLPGRGKANEMSELEEMKKHLENGIHPRARSRFGSSRLKQRKDNEKDAWEDFRDAMSFERDTRDPETSSPFRRPRRP